MQKPFEEGVLDSAYSSSQPSVAPLSPAPHDNPQRNPQRRGYSAPIGPDGDINRQAIPNADELVMEAVMDAALAARTNTNDSVGIINKMKSLIKSGKSERFAFFNF